MEQRQAEILKTIIESYLDRAVPVASSYLADHKNFDISSATIRHEMGELESNGYIEQPHTSAGRIPTIKGINFYIDHLMTESRLTDKECQHFETTVHNDGVKALAREIAGMCQAAVIITQNETDYYYTGLSHLFRQPEFVNTDMIITIGDAVDHLESMLPHFTRETIGAAPMIFIGKNNPLGKEFAAVFISNTHAHPTYCGLISPVRTNYAYNVAVLAAVANYL